jgi:hypothetical protein
VEERDKLSRGPLHSIRTPNSGTKAWDATERRNSNVDLGGGVHVRHEVQRLIWVPTQHLP